MERHERDAPLRRLLVRVAEERDLLEEARERRRHRLLRIARRRRADERLVELARGGDELDEVLGPVGRLVGALRLEPGEEPGALQHLLHRDPGVERGDVAGEPGEHLAERAERAAGGGLQALRSRRTSASAS